MGSARTGPDGSLEHVLPDYELGGATVVTCLAGSCSVLVRIGQIFDIPAVVISAPLVIDIAGIDVQVDPIATFEVGRNEVVATATVTCDQPTPVSVRATLTQGDTVWQHRVTRQRCTPTAPLTASSTKARSKWPCTRI